MNDHQLQLLREAYQRNSNDYKLIHGYLKGGINRLEVGEAMMGLMDMLEQSADMMVIMLDRIIEAGLKPPVQDRFIQKPLNYGTGKTFTPKATPTPDVKKSLTDDDFVPPNFIPDDELVKPVGKATASGDPMITDKQKKAVYAIGKYKLGLTMDQIQDYCHDLFGCKYEELDMRNASDFIGKLESYNANREATITKPSVSESVVSAGVYTNQNTNVTNRPGGPATPAQIKTIYGVGIKNMTLEQVDERCKELYDCVPDELTMRDASEFIDLLRTAAK